MTSEEALSFLVAKAKREGLYSVINNLILGSLAKEKSKVQSWCDVPAGVSEKEAVVTRSRG